MKAKLKSEIIIYITINTSTDDVLIYCMEQSLLIIYTCTKFRETLDTAVIFEDHHILRIIVQAQQNFQRLTFYGLLIIYENSKIYDPQRCIQVHTATICFGVPAAWKYISIIFLPYSAKL